MGREGGAYLNGAGQGCLLEDRYFMCVLFCFCVVNIIHLNVRSRAKGNSFVFPRVLMNVVRFSAAACGEERCVTTLKNGCVADYMLLGEKKT